MAAKGDACKVRIWTDYGTERETDGILEKGLQFCFMPKEERIVFAPMVRIVDGKKVVYAPDKTHGNLDHEFLLKLARAQKYKALFRKKIGDEIFECECICTGTIDGDIFNNNISPEFARTAFDLARSKILEFLMDMTDKQMIAQLITGFFVGFPTGMGFLIVCILMGLALT